MADKKQPDFRQLLTDALTLEGHISECYSAFWSYSYANQILAYWQLGQAEPINTYNGWAKLGRHVKKGAKAIELCMPFNIKTDELDDKGEPKVIMAFGYRRNWFGLSATEGEKFVMPEIPALDIERVEKNLDIKRVKFEHTDGNTQGYSIRRNYAINPLAKYPLKTAFHELAHIMLGHTAGTMSHTEHIARNIKEVEAEGVAYLLSSSFGQTKSAAESRGYIQDWLGTDEVDEKTAKRIFKAASDILKANREVTA